MKVCACLHNWLLDGDEFIENENHRYIPSGLRDGEQENGFFVEGTWRTGAFAKINHQGGNNYIRNADEIRKKFCEYFNDEGNLILVS